MTEATEYKQKQFNIDTMCPARWEWMMNYCKNQGIPPAQKWAWDKAAIAWEEK